MTKATTPISLDDETIDRGLTRLEGEFASLREEIDEMDRLVDDLLGALPRLGAAIEGHAKRRRPRKTRP